MAPQGIDTSGVAVMSIPIIFAAAIILSFGELMYRRTTTRVHDVERDPLLPRRERRRRPRPSRLLTAPGRPVGAADNTRPVIRKYGTAPPGPISNSSEYIRFSNDDLAVLYGESDWHQPFANLAPPVDVPSAVPAPLRPTNRQPQSLAPSLDVPSAVPAPLRPDNRQAQDTAQTEVRLKSPRKASTESQKTWRTVQICRESGECKDGVKTVKSLRTGELYIIKTMSMRMSTRTGKYKLPNEAYMLSTHIKSHPNIIALRGYKTSETPDQGICHIAYELCSGGDLLDFINHWGMRMQYQGEFVPSIFVLHFIESMAAALGYIHLAGDEAITHGDIKHANIFLRWTANSSKYDLPDLILGDFGFTEFEVDSQGVHGTMGFYPPECASALIQMSGSDSQRKAALEAQVMTTASDIYSFGVTLFTLIFLSHGMGRDQFSFAPPADQIDALFDNTPEIGERLPACVRSILKRCLAHAPNNRLSTDELASHRPILQNVIANLYDRGYGMPAGSYPRPALVQGNEQLTAPSSSAYSRHTLFDAEDPMAGISGFTDNKQLCWDVQCPHHAGPNSKHHLKSGCAAAAPRNDAAMNSATSSSSSGAAAHAEGYADAILQYGYHDATEG